MIIQGKSALRLGACILAMGWASFARADFVYYSLRTSFDAAAPGTTLENFENSHSSSALVDGPLDQTTNNIAFHTGEIIPNLRITSVGSSTGDFYVNNFYASTILLTVNRSDNFARLDFYQSAITQFGIDLFTSSSGGDYTVRIYGNSGLLDTKTVTSSGFFGFTSTVGVTRVELQANSFESFDNIAIGGGISAEAVPEPTSLALLGLGAGGLMIQGWRRRRATTPAC